MHALAELAKRVAELERRHLSLLRHGTVEEVDPEKALVRLRIGGSDDKPFLSPWLPYAQIAGAMKVHSPPSQGQQMTMIAPTGDFRQSIAMPMTWSNQNEAPSKNGDEHVLTFGDVRIEIKGSEVHVTVPTLKFTCDGSTFVLTGDGLQLETPTVSIEGDRVEHNSLNIGHDHKHRDSAPGAGLTGVPAP